MAIIMAYHQLIEKDSMDISTCWKWSIVWILMGVIALCLVTLFSFEGLEINYNGTCLIPGELDIQINKTNIILGNLDKIKSTIDEVYCKYVGYIPLVEGIYAVFLLVLFLICGHAGRVQNAIFTQPWRIVVPTIVAFSFLTIIGFFHLGIVIHNLDGFCNSIREAMQKHHLVHNNYTCFQLIEYFSVDKQSIVPANVNYGFCRVFPILTAFLWLSALIIMITRCIFAVDFQLILVTISKRDASNVLKLYKKVQFQEDEDDAFYVNKVEKTLDKDEEVSTFVSEVVSKVMARRKIK